MEHRSLPLVAGLIAALTLPIAVRAADGDWQSRLDKATALQAEAKAVQKEADKAFQEKSEACLAKFLVNACRNDARREHLERTQVARRLDNDGKAIEREVRKEQFAARAAERDAEARQRETDLQRREAETTAGREADEARIAAVQAKKAQQAIEGERRKAAAEEAHRRKVAAHEAKLAEKKLKAERKAAAAAAQADPNGKQP